jgi:predicted  nucleic acid-binding Zn-ribbon protein
MSTPGTILREIHRLRKNAKDLSTRVEQGPKQQQLQKDKVARQEQLLKQAQDEVKHSKVTAHEKEVSLKSIDEQIKKYEKQLNDIMSKKEYDALKHELSHARDKVAKIEDEILTVLTEIEERTAKLPELEKNLKETKAQAEQLARDYETRMADLANQHKEVTARLAEVEATLPEDIKVPYDRLIRAMGEDALAAVEGNVCAACYTGITPQNRNDLLRSAFVLCKSCGRMLYLPE